MAPGRALCGAHHTEATGFAAAAVVMLALGIARSLASFLYGVPTSDVATFAVMTIMLTAVALVACVIPARRAMWVNPITALRYE